MKNKKKVLQIINQATKASFINGKIHPSKVKSFTESFKKLGGGQAIIYLTEYLRALKREEEKTILYIESSIPLSSEHKNRIINLFKKDHYISEVRVKLDPSLKGGVLIKIGDMVYEDSLQSRIKQLGEAISNA